MIALCDCAWAQRDYRILPTDFGADKQHQMMRDYLRRQVHDALDVRREEFEVALGSLDRFSEFVQKRRRYLQQIFHFPSPHGAPRAEVTGVLNEDEFRVEKILLESSPGFHVTANLYRPNGSGPFPAILHPCGHSENGKAADAYQRANRLLARHGFIVLCYDPIGQGERKQILSPDGDPTHRASSEHQQLGVAPILLGSSLASYMVHDAVRCMDYLCSRPDVDPVRIGCTGNSGGGNLTSYLMAQDPRVAAAAPGCFMTTHRLKNESPGPGDAEQNLFGQIREGFDLPDFILTRAPKPTLILAATRDFVPIEGTWDAFRQAKRAYTMLGEPGQVDLIECNEEHGFSRRLREGAVAFFARHLQDRIIDVSEDPSLHVRPDEELQVTPEGQVLKLPDERSILELYAAHERQLAEQRPSPTRAIIRKVTEIRPLRQLPRPEVRVVSDGVPTRLTLHPETGIVLPAWHWPEGDGQPIMIAPQAGVASAIDRANQWNSAGHPVLVIDVRDSGETRTRNWRFQGADYYIGYMLGRSWLAMRCEDLLVAARWLTEQHRVTSVGLIADGELVPAAQHAAALEPECVALVSVHGGLASWRGLMLSSQAHDHLHNAVHGALKHYDLPDLSRVAQDR